MRKSLAFNKILAFALVMVMVIIMIPTHFFPQAADDDTPRTSNMFIRSGDVSVEGNLQRGTTLAASKVADPFTSAALRSSTKSLNGAIRSGASVNGITPAPVSDEPEILTYSQLNYLGFYDISLRKGGADVQPDGQVKVTIKNIDLSNAKGANVIHILDSAEAIRDAQTRGTAILVGESLLVNAFAYEAAIAEQVTGQEGVIVIEEIAGEINAERNAVTFYTNSFSIFAISDEPILTVNFYNGAKDENNPNTNKIVSIRVKARDASNATEFEKIVYDPGVNKTLEDNVLFRGWFETNDYTVEDAEYYDTNGNLATNALTIAQVREKIAAELNSTGFNGGEIDFFAMLFIQYTVTYFDEDGNVCLGRDFVLQRYDSAEAQVDYQVTLTYAPHGQFENFEGWKLKSGDKTTTGDGFYTSKMQNLIGIYSGGTDTSPSGTLQTGTINGVDVHDYVYKTPTWTRIKGDIYLYAYSPEGRWLVFDENGKGGTYIAPQFVKTNENTIDPNNATNAELGYPVTMQRYGYEFGGWFTTKAAADNNTVKYTDWNTNNPPAGAFTFGNTLSANTTIYASWVPHTTANYVIIIWTQNITGDGYDFNESIPMTGNVGSVVNTVSQQGTGDNAYVRITNTTSGTRNIQMTGFHLKEFTQNVTITTENNAVVNIYYDRTEYTLTFRINNNYSTYIYIETTSNTGTQYAYIDGEYVELTRNVVRTLDGTSPYTGNIYYVTENNNATSYGVVNNELVALTRRGNNNNNYYWTYATSEYNYIPSYGDNDNNPEKWGTNDGVTFFRVYWAGSMFNRTWRLTNNNNGQVYNGTVYIRERAKEYTGIRYTTSAQQAANNTQYGFDSVSGAMLPIQEIVSWTLEGEPYTGTRYTRESSGSTNVVKTITALYQQNISDYFPIVGNNNVTYNNGERWNPQNSSIFSNVLVYIDIMPAENTIFLLDTASRPLKTMNWYIEALPGEAGSVSAPNTLYNYNNAAISSGGRQFVLYKSIGARYNFVTRAEDFIELVGFERFGSDSQYDGSGRYIYSTTQDGTINFYYTRKSYPILFMDGTYVDGNGNIQDEINRGELAVSDNELYGSDISSYNSFRVDDYNGYTLEGWYLDETCTQKYNFTTMPEGGITVYAKWRLTQYRVFLHPNAGSGDSKDMSLDWGSESQEMNFRVSYNGTISVPTGQRTGYYFSGWYTDAGLTKSFIPATKLNEQTVSTPYDKTTDMTDDMDKWGDLSGDATHDDPWNSDITGNDGSDRFWITKKLDLYAKWSKKIDGADGMYIKYVTTDDEGRTGKFDDGTTEYCDGFLYSDGAFAYGQAACDAPANQNPELHFRYWVVQCWDASTNTFFDATDSNNKLIIVYPGERFETDIEYAERISITDPDDATHIYDYYMVLRAEYTEAVPQDTKIVYDANGGSFTSTPTGYSAATVDGYATLSMPLIVNEAIDILPGSVVTRTGYVFAGWSLERNSDVWLFGGETNYSADNLTTNPTGNDPSNTLYAVWVNETFDVTVDKIINNLLTTAFNGTITFNYEIANNAPNYALVSNGKYTITEFVDTVNNGVTTRSVVSNEYNSTGTVTITFTDGEVSGDLPVIAKVPYGHKLTVTEVAITGFELDSVVNAETTKNAGTLSGYTFTINPILADDTITFTNTRKMVDLVIEKTVTNAIDYGKTFTYELTFGNYKIDGSSTKTITITTDDTGKGSATLSVPYETAVTVEEKQTDSVPLTPYKIYVNGEVSSNFKWSSTGLTDDTNTVVYTNERLVYKVKIAKIVNSIVAADYTNAPYEFNFKYELEGSTVYGTLTATVTANGGNGVYGVYTPAGQTEPQDYIEVPYGAKLTITEALNSDAFTTSYAGTVSGNGKEFVINTVNSDVDVKFTNVRKTVNVKVTKIVENFTGAASFPFSATWTVDTQTVTVVPENEGDSILGTGDYWQFTVPYGATVVVTEDGTADVVINGNTYDVSVAFDTVITKVAGDNVTQSGLAGTVTEIKNATEIKFTNTRKMVSATITKELDNNGETDFWSTYEFPIKYTITDVDLASPTEVTLFIKDGVVKTVDNIPFGAVIKVEELTDTTPNGQPSIGQVFIVSGDNGKQIALTESATAFTIKNKRQVSDLTITKAGENLNGRTFMFRINSLNSDYDQIVMIKGAGSVTIKGLQTGYNYEVTEITSWSWEFSETPTVNVVTTGPAVKITSVTGGAQFSFLSEAEVTFTNKEKPTNWLRNETYIRNKLSVR